MIHLTAADAIRLGLHPTTSRLPRRHALKPDWRPGFLVQLAALGVFKEFGEPRVEHRFHARRAWKLDVAWPAPLFLAVEIEGGTWIRGRHVQGSGFSEDARKYAEAMLLGWRVLRVTPAQIARGDAALYTAQILARIRTGEWLPPQIDLAGPPKRPRVRRAAAITGVSRRGTRR